MNDGMNESMNDLFISVALLSVSTLLPRPHCRFVNLSLPDRRKFGYEITLSPDRILIFKFEFHVER